MDNSNDDNGALSVSDIDGVIDEVQAGFTEEERQRYGDDHARAALFIIGGLAEYEKELGPSPGIGPRFTISDACVYIAKVGWQFAKTMPQWPHEYTVREWAPDLEADFVAFVQLIRREGEVKPWPKDSPSPRYHHAYLAIDGWQYWTMGAPIAGTTVINRARVDSAGAA